MRTIGITYMVQYAVEVFVFIYHLQNIVSFVLKNISEEEGIC